MKGKFKFNGTGGEIFSLMLGQGLLCLITFGIYTPWAVAKVTQYMSKSITLDDKPFEFSGTGGEFFSVLFIQYLLVMVTLGIYAPIASLKIQKFFVDNTSWNGKALQLDDSNSCDYWITVFVQQLLTMITFGIYAPWATIKISKAIMERTSWDGQKFSTTAQGGELFSLYFVQGLLVMITFGIYTAWAVCKIENYWISSITWGSNKFKANMDGGELFSLILVHGMILTGLTCGIYSSWYQAKELEFYYGHIEIE